jgi:anaerobic selenocysteine-containing dehydrogenase
MPALRTACPLDCPDACSMEVHVTDGRLERIDGSTANPVTAGYICSKVRGIADHLYGEERLRHPLLRTGPKGSGAFERLAWDEALDLAARKLVEARDAHGGESIVPLSYGGSNGFLTQDNADARLFYRLGASRLARTVCAIPTSMAASGLYGKMGGTAFPDYAHAKLIVVWGMNPGASGIHLAPIIRKAKEGGAKLVVVDPRRIKTALIADHHLAVRPGTDLPVALSIINWLFASGRADERFLAEHATGAAELRRRAAAWSFGKAAEIAGIDAGELEEVARLYADSSPAVVRCGWGLERNRNGGSAVAAVLALPAVAGKFGVRGGGYTMSNSGVYGIDGTRSIGEAEPKTRVINMNLLGRDLLDRDDPPIKALFVYNNNGLATLPNQEAVRRGLMRDDLFTVVFDQVMTDTALLADLVLPATTFLEHDELARGYGAYGVNRIRPVIDRVGESRSNIEVFSELCRRTGVARTGDVEDAGVLIETILDGHPMGEAGRRRLENGEIVYPSWGSAPVQMIDERPRTSDGKIHLVPEHLDAEAPGGLYSYRDDPATAEHPLALISPNTGKTISSTFGQLRRGQVPVEIHREDAAERGIAGGDKVRIWNGYGEVRCLARVSDAVRPGVLSLPKGLWSHNTLNGATSNALSPDTLTDIGGGACFNDARVQVERI